MATIHIALVCPEIPQNTGNIGRLTLGVGAQLHLVKPLGFDISEKAVRRAGLDYWQFVKPIIHESVDDFLTWLEGKNVLLLSTKANKTLNQAKIEKDSVLVFGSETKGLPQVFHDRFPGYTIPMAQHIRSYNLSNSVAIASYFAMSQLSPNWMVNGNEL